MVLTVRFEMFRPDTFAWLAKHQINCKFSLYVRRGGDYRTDNVVKLELLEQAKKDLNDNNAEFIVDSLYDKDAVKMWRDNGYTCLQCT